MNIFNTPVDAPTLARGSVMVYIRQHALSSVAIPLPYTHVVNSVPNTLLTYRFSSNGVLQLLAYRLDPNSTIYGFPNHLWEYRYIIIPFTGSGSAALKDVDINDFNAVAAALNIPN